MGDSNCSYAPEKSKAFIHADAAIGAGTAVTVPNAATDGNVYKTATVINDTDQDVKVTFITDSGYAGEFIVPKSIKGFTKSLKADKFDSLNFKVISLHAASPAVGNITFNLSN